MAYKTTKLAFNAYTPAQLKAISGQLATEYGKAHAEILKRLSSGTLTDWGAAFKRQQLAQIDAVFADLDNATDAWAHLHVPTLYQNGLKVVDGKLAPGGLSKMAHPGQWTPMDLGMTKMHTEAVQDLIEEFSLPMKLANTQASQYIEDMVARAQVISKLTGADLKAAWKQQQRIREATLSAMTQSLIAGDTRRQASKTLVQELQKRGITSFIDKSGRQWDMADYAEMNARTVAARAQRVSMRKRMYEHGYDLVRISDHDRECPLCRPWEGKVVSLTGNTSGYPTLAQAEAKGYGHPRCCHNEAPWKVGAGTSGVAPPPTLPDLPGGPRRGTTGDSGTAPWAGMTDEQKRLQALTEQAAAEQAQFQGRAFQAEKTAAKLAEDAEAAAKAQAQAELLERAAAQQAQLQQRAAQVAKDQQQAQLKAQAEALEKAKKNALRRERDRLRREAKRASESVETAAKSVASHSTADPDAAWATFGKAEHFGAPEQAALPGVHKKFFVHDRVIGEKWLFKPAGGDEFLAHGDEVAYKVGRLIDPDAVEVRAIDLGGGRLGSVQHWRGDVLGDLKGANPAALSADDLAAIQREHVIDWLISNHDGHGANFLRMSDGQLRGIDKGQLFKYFGRDRLSIDYAPNAGGNFPEPFYNQLWRAYRDGRVDMDLDPLWQAIARVEAIGDDEYIALLEPYASRRFKGAALQDFYEQAVARKNSIRADFEQFVGALRPQARNPAAKVLAETAKDLDSLGGIGKSMPWDTDDIELQQVLAYVEDLPDGGRRTVLHLKVRPDADGKVTEWVKGHEITTEVTIGKASRAATQAAQILPEDTFHEDILSAVKTVNHHASDGAYNHEKLQKALGHKGKLESIKQGDVSGEIPGETSGDVMGDLMKALTGPDDAAKAAIAAGQGSDVHQMAEAYLKWLDDIEDAVQEKKTLGQFAPYKPKPKRTRKPKAAPVSSDGVSVVEAPLRTEAKDLPVGGRIRVRPGGEQRTYREIFGRSEIAGHQYEVDFGDGVKAVYRPCDDTNPWSVQGQLRIAVDEQPSLEALERLTEKLQKLGITSRPPTDAERELLYLERQAYVSLEHRNVSQYKALVDDLDARSATTEDRVAALRGYWADKLGVDDVTQIPEYNWEGEFETLPQGVGGYRRQSRFDVSEREIARDMKGYALVHNVQAGGSTADNVEALLSNNGAMISTQEKLRMGIPPGGMSPARDMETGGSHYHFTRIRKVGTKPRDEGIYYKATNLRRMDAISYDRDCYGRTTGGFVEQNRQASVDQWLRASRESSNETCIQDACSLADSVQWIVVRSEQERKRVIGAFEKAGLSVLPDGRKAESVVVYAGM